MNTDAITLSLTRSTSLESALDSCDYDSYSNSINHEDQRSVQHGAAARPSIYQQATLRMKQRRGGGGVKTVEADCRVYKVTPDQDGIPFQNSSAAAKMPSTVLKYMKKCNGASANKQAAANEATDAAADGDAITPKLGDTSKDDDRQEQNGSTKVAYKSRLAKLRAASFAIPSPARDTASTSAPEDHQPASKKGKSLMARMKKMNDDKVAKRELVQLRQFVDKIEFYQISKPSDDVANRDSSADGGSGSAQDDPSETNSRDSSHGKETASSSAPASLLERMRKKNDILIAKRERAHLRQMVDLAEFYQILEPGPQDHARENSEGRRGTGSVEERREIPEEGTYCAKRAMAMAQRERQRQQQQQRPDVDERSAVTEKRYSAGRFSKYSKPYESHAAAIRGSRPDAAKCQGPSREQQQRPRPRDRSRVRINDSFARCVYSSGPNNDAKDSEKGSMKSRPESVSRASWLEEAAERRSKTDEYRKSIANSKTASSDFVKYGYKQSR